MMKINLHMSSFHNIVDVHKNPVIKTPMKCFEDVIHSTH